MFVEWTRECLAVEVAGSIRSTRGIERLAHFVSVHGAPRYLRSHSGPEFVPTAVMRWLLDANVDAVHIAPGKPWQNGTDESFNGRFRDECLNMEWFRTRQEAAALMEPGGSATTQLGRSSLGCFTPHEYKTKQLQLSAKHARRIRPVCGCDDEAG